MKKAPTIYPPDGGQVAALESGRGELLLVAAIVFVIVALVMAGAHEKHYRGRRGILLDARLRGLEGRLEAVESILGEDRLT